MRLVYIEPGPDGERVEVKVGDVIKHDGDTYTVKHFREPHSSASSGRVTVDSKRGSLATFTMEYYVGVIGAEWIEREDR